MSSIPPQPSAEHGAGNSGIRTTCPYCGVGCGLLVDASERERIVVEGDAQHPANFGRLCAKGAALAETLSLDDRLLRAEIHGKPVPLDLALDRVAEGFGRVVRDHGPDAVAFYLSGQMLTEDYYVANKLMKGFIGSANVDTNSRLCMASTVAGHRRAFGSDTVPGTYEDLELANLVVLVGSNLAWCHPVLYQRIDAARAARPAMRIVVIDPRRTLTCEGADLHLALKPGTDATLFNGLLLHLSDAGQTAQQFVREATDGVDAALEAARASAPSFSAVAERCGLDAAVVAKFYDWFAATERTVTVFSQGINQSSSGTDKVGTILNCHLLTGRIGRPGMGPFSVTGQPNAMGGREVGGLANQLAAHLDFDRPEHLDLLRRFWRAPKLATQPGLKAIDMFRAVEAGRIKAIWIMATNPLVSLPDAARMRQALAACDFVVVSDCIRGTETARAADILLPALAWGEKEGTVTNSERRISRQRAFLPRPGDARQDWQLVCGVATRLGFGEAFAYRSAAEIFREHAALSAFENDGTRDFDIGGMAAMTDADYANFAPTLWPQPRDGGAARSRFFADGRFYTANGKARFVAVTPRAPINAADAAYPLLLNTGRVRDHWHTMTRTGKSPRLSQHEPEPRLAIHPDDAQRYGVRDGMLADIRSRYGKAIARVQVSADQTIGEVFLPMHWNGSFAARGRVNELVNPELDPISGQPELKSTPVGVQRFPARWFGFALLNHAMPWPHAAYWASSRTRSCWRYDLAGDDAPADAWARLQKDVRKSIGAPGDWHEQCERSADQFRGIALHDGKLIAYLLVAPKPAPDLRDRAAKWFASGLLSVRARRELLSDNIGPQPPTPSDPLVCACFNIGRRRIVEAIRAEALTTCEAIEAVTHASGHCGSCRPELHRLLRETVT